MRYSLFAVVNVYLSADTQLSKCISRSCQPHILVFLFTDVHLYAFAWLESRVSVVFGNMVLLPLCCKLEIEKNTDHRVIKQPYILTTSTCKNNLKTCKTRF